MATSPTSSTPSQCVKRSIQTTSVRGVTRALKEPVKCLRYTWLGVIALLFGLLLYTIASLLLNYFAYPVVVAITEKHLYEGPDTVSEFHVCNKNPIASYKSMQGVLAYEDYQQNVKTTFASKMAPEDLSHLASYEGYFQNIGLDKAQSIGHAYADLVLECKVSGRDGPYALYDAGPCNSLYEIKPVPHEKYFNCYAMVRKGNSSVSVAGISMIAHLDNRPRKIRTEGDPEDDFGSGSGLVLGMRRSPDLSNDWVDEVVIESGTHAKLNVKPGIRKKLPAPYGMCGLYEQSDNANLCRIRCLQNATLHKCNCNAYESHYLADWFDDPCGKLQSDVEETVRRVQCMMEVYRTQLDHCGCPEHCEYYSYDITFISSPWPQLEQQLLFYQAHIKGKPFKDKYHFYDDVVEYVQSNGINAQTTARQWLQEPLIRDNFAMVDIHFHGSIQTIEDRKQTNLSDLFGRIGGSMNLFSGISLLIFMEIIDLMVKVCLSCRSQNKQVDVPEDTATH